MCLSMPHWQHVYNMLAITLIILHLFYALPIATLLSTCIKLTRICTQNLTYTKQLKKNPSDYHNYTANYIFMDGDINNTD